MKLAKPLLQSIAVAVAVSTVSACDIMKPVKPKTKVEKKLPYDCPGCGLG